MFMTYILLSPDRNLSGLFCGLHFDDQKQREIYSNTLEFQQ